MKKLDRKSKKRKPAIFLSHSSKDNEIVTRFAFQLNRLGIDVWLDDWELEVGDHLNKRIKEAIQKSRYLVVAITPAFLKSDWCKKELKDAMAKEKLFQKKVVLPLIFKKVKMPELLKEERIYLDFGTGYYNELAKLAAMIHQFSKQKIMDAIGGTELKNIDAVANALIECGWDGVALIDADYFSDVKKLKGVNTQGNLVQFYPDEVKRLNPDMSPTLRKLISI